MPYIYNDEDNYPMIEDPFGRSITAAQKRKPGNTANLNRNRSPTTAAGTAATTIGRAKPARSAGTTSMIAITTLTWTIMIRHTGARITISTRT